MFIRLLSKTHVLLQCDVCSHEFERYASQIKNLKGLHFCPGIGLGRKSGGSKCKQIAQQTNGVLRIKIRKKFFDTYGVEHPLQIQSVMEQCRQTNIERYGVDNPQKRNDIKQKSEETNLKRYGVRNVFQIESVRKNCSSLESRQKAFETKKRRGNLWKSKPEDRLYEVLCEMFGSDDVKRQVHVYKWPIDFYVESINTYVQYDSHWHGYNDIGVLRDLKEVAEHKNKHDVEIHKKMLIDITQNVYFLEREMKLVRYIGTKQGNIDQQAVTTLLFGTHS
jgi:hypothetical protein